MRDFIVRQRQLLTFLVIGGLSALIDVGLMTWLLWEGMATVPATSIAFFTGLVFNLTGHARFTFSARIAPATVVRYLCVVALTYSVTLGCVGLAEAMDIRPEVGKIVALFIVPVIGFVLGKYWVFKTPEPSSAT